MKLFVSAQVLQIRRRQKIQNAKTIETVALYLAVLKKVYTNSNIYLPTTVKSITCQDFFVYFIAKANANRRKNEIITWYEKPDLYHQSEMKME